MSKVVSLASKPKTIGILVAEYNSLREQKKSIESQMAKVSADLKSYAEKNGTKDDKGSYYVEYGDYMIGKQARKSISFDVPKAVTFFRKHGIPECVDTIEVINSDAVEQAINEGIISVEDLEKITETKISYSIDVRAREEITDVQETQVAASRKVRGRFA